MKSTIDKIFKPIHLSFDPDKEQERLAAMVPEPIKFREFPSDIVNLKVPQIHVQVY